MSFWKQFLLVIAFDIAWKILSPSIQYLRERLYEFGGRLIDAGYDTESAWVGIYAPLLGCVCCVLGRKPR